MTNNKGQVTIFIILAIILVAAVAGFFVFRNLFTSTQIPANMEPVYASFLSCLEENTLTGIDVLESQGGYINLPDFETGSVYMPFGSQLNFLGNPIPYWYYVSGNNVEKEQVPSKSEMEDSLALFLEKRMNNCIFEKYYEQGFEIIGGTPKVSAFVSENQVEINLDMDLNILKDDEEALVRNHKVIVKSKLGSLYDSAKKIYDYEQDTLFLENYAVDTLRLYAPVDGVELTCSPVTWNAEEVFKELGEAIEANTLFLKTKGGDFSLNSEDNKYFIVDVDVPQNVRFLNSKRWSNSFEVAPSEEALLIAQTVGNQPALGILGFCYVPYHFVYNVRYPVLVQIYDGTEIFQFPLAVVIQGNKPRKALESSATQIGLPELCAYKNTLVQVNIYDGNLNEIDAEISYECFGTTCNIGKTEQGILEGYFPQCANGYILAKSDGFEEAKYLYSTVDGGIADIILDRFYNLNVELNLDGKSSSERAIISFVSDKSSATMVYPETSTIELIEGQYEIQVYVYKNSSLKLDETKYKQCMEIPQSGLGGFFGLTQEKCFDVKIPAQIVSNVLSGGGKQNYYILESELSGSSSIELNAESLRTPKSLEELQDNYALFEEKGLDVYFK